MCISTQWKEKSSCSAESQPTRELKQRQPPCLRTKDSYLHGEMENKHWRVRGDFFSSLEIINRNKLRKSPNIWKLKTSFLKIKTWVRKKLTGKAENTWIE